MIRTFQRETRASFFICKKWVVKMTVFVGCWVRIKWADIRTLGKHLVNVSFCTHECLWPVKLSCRKWGWESNFLLIRKYFVKADFVYTGAAGSIRVSDSVLARLRFICRDLWPMEYVWCKSFFCTDWLVVWCKSFFCTDRLVGADFSEY